LILHNGFYADTKIRWDPGEHIQIKQRLLEKLLEEYQGWDFSPKG